MGLSTKIKSACAVLASVIAVLVLGAQMAKAAVTSTPAPGWEITSHSSPTHLVPGGKGIVAVNVFNIGAADATGEAEVTDELPEGIEGQSEKGWTCKAGGAGPGTVCTITLPVIKANLWAEPELNVKIAAGAHEGSVNNVAAISGGGASSMSRTDAFTISSTPAKFGFSQAASWFSNPNGTLDTRAGSHPYAFTFTYSQNTSEVESGLDRTSEGEARNLTFKAPPGFIGNPTSVEQCPQETFFLEQCPPSTQIGDDLVTLGAPTLVHFNIPVYDLVPPPGHPAEFAFVLYGNKILLDASVRSDGDYGITEQVNNLPQVGVTGNAITIWGTPAQRGHNDLRQCGAGESRGTGCEPAGGRNAFLTVPTSCEGAVPFTAKANDWANESITGEIGMVTENKQRDPQGFEECEDLGFAPAISVSPDTAAGDTPAGLTFEIKTPQEGLDAGELETYSEYVVPELSSANIKNTTVVLPEGVAINPGQATGLLTCQESEDGVGSKAPVSCPNGSIVGTDEIETPLLPHALKGNVYLLADNPPHLQLLLQAKGEGVELKLVGHVELNEATGQLTATFEHTPELPFSAFRLAFSGGARAALTTPTSCGEFAATSDFTPWSTPFGSDVLATGGFLVSTRCTSHMPFTPTMSAGATTDQAGGYTDFSMLLTREDEQQRISTLQFKTPKGLLGEISQVPLCGEPEASQGTCPAASQIGHTVTEAGPGPYPLVIPEPGHPPAPIYLTGGYKGAPFGLSIVVPVDAGPFDLGTIVVRASIAVDPHTSQLTITTDPLPIYVKGIPADLRAINALIDRPEFMFNPTNCEPQSFSGTATSIEGATAPISSHFQMGSCRALTFKPNFKVSTAGKTSRGNGASLDAKIVYPTGPLGANQASSQANVEKVRVELPKQLPSRLTTLQKACTAAQFDSNPSGCPAASKVGSATAITPVLPVPLTGPAYFVSHGGEAFPQLIIVLQGYGVTVDLVGDTFISKKGVTSSTFDQVPDVPITSFELRLPQGPGSALGANLPEKAHGSFCGQKLVMPTEFTGQNGAYIKQSTPVAVTGCKAVKHKNKKHNKRHKRR